MSKEINYTICPVGNALYIAANTSILKDELEKIDYNPVKLQTLDISHWTEHFTYENDRLFREGGNTPPIWSKSYGRKPLLIGLNLIPSEQAILTRKDSDINTVADLKGKRLGIPDRVNVTIDHQKSSTLEGYENALKIAGLSKDDVEWVYIKDETPDYPGGQRWHFKKGLDIEALDEGKVDAIFIKNSAPEVVLDTGNYKKVINLQEQDVVPPVNNEYPNVLTVSQKLAEEEPEVVVAFLKAVIKAARWAKTHKEEAEALLAEQTFGTVDQYHRAFPADFYQHLEPNFAEEGLDALQVRAQFLYDHGFAKEVVNVREWADKSFLERALKELEAE